MFELMKPVSEDRNSEEVSESTNTSIAIPPIIANPEIADEDEP